MVSRNSQDGVSMRSESAAPLESIADVDESTNEGIFDVSKQDERIREKDLHQLASHFDARTQWVFLSKERNGALVVYSNGRPERIRALARDYLKTKRRTSS